MAQIIDISFFFIFLKQILEIGSYLRHEILNKESLGISKNGKPLKNNKYFRIRMLDYTAFGTPIAVWPSKIYRNCDKKKMVIIHGNSCN